MSDQIDRLLFLDDFELCLTGGCFACGLEADQMCVACGLCNCDRHDTCTREPSERTATPSGPPANSPPTSHDHR
ncbi:hypothetical protein [Streptomyces beihaiensis]|uniref:Uncharacterized protein n=1 Tax=Streptomyces beihaiensis TaxID=2984495 RepID=A0ABT3TRA6_9ACTN|nr:hypothetical protein [Streptomyces beihaiensis]MCX3059587.1 hypothetical protein [Streptomyces beihaiensis]